MNEVNWLQAIKEAQNGNDVLFNKTVASNFEGHFYQALLGITHEESLVRELYISTITKFWERFVLQGEKLPESNVDGYIFQMAKNAFFEMNRKKQTYKHSFVSPVESIEIVEKYSSLVGTSGYLDQFDTTKEKDAMVVQIHEAVQSLDDTCKEIIEQNIVQGTSLTILKDELGISGTYNAIVQKKKRCLQALKRILTKQLNSNSFKFQQL